MLSNSSKYALTAVLYLAVNSSFEHKILAKDISKENPNTQAYLSKLMQELTRHNLISSVRDLTADFI
ncbi:Rrf2 family transcriptional regulator [Winogradskyella maritima]|nr:Rrf2 family transcriptional regulator [Winogradskyella maritima]